MSGSFIPLSSIKASPTAAPQQDGFIPLSAVSASPQENSDSTPSHMERIGRELLQPLIGMEQIAGRILPIPEYQNGKWVSRAVADDEMAKQNQTKIDEARGGNTGVNWEQMGLDTINPLNYLGGPAGKALGIGEKLAAPVAGAVSAVTQPVTGGSFWKQKATQAAEGAAIGKGSDLIGGAASSVVAPTMRGAAKTLNDLGVRLTPGQMVGGGAKKTEDSLTSVPFAGDMIRNSQIRGIHDFNHAAINEGLKHIGGSIPANVPAGRDSLNYMSQAIQNAYGQVIPNMKGQLDPELQKDITGVATLGKNLPDAEKGQLVGIIKHDILAKFSQGGGISGQTVQEIGSELDNLKNALKLSDSPDKRRLGTAVQELDASMDRMLDRVNPALAKQKQAIDLSYAHYKTIEKASGMQGAKEGVFTPAQLSNAIRSRDKSKDKSAYAKGFSLMQGLASAGEKTLSSSVPDSGTAGRAMMGAIPVLAAGGEFGHLAGAAAALGATAAPYTKVGTAAVRHYMTPSATRQALGAVVGRSGKKIAPAATKIIQDATQ